MMSSSTDRKLRIAIVGGGIGGLICAIALKNRVDIEISVYEAAAQIAEVGAGFTIWPRTWNIVKSMGLEEDLTAILAEKPSNERRVLFTTRKSNQSQGFTFYEACGTDSMPFHRQELQKVLLKHLPSSCQLHLQYTLDRCEESEDLVNLYFKNGIVKSHDVVIGADGVRSAVRQSLLSQKSAQYPNNGIRYTGTICFRGLIPKDKLAALDPDHPALRGGMSYSGTRRQIIAYPISKGTLINVAAFVLKPTGNENELEAPPRRDTTSDEVLGYFSGWEDQVQHLLSLLEKPIAWPIQDLKPLDTYVSRRIAVLGDAAHAMTPHLAAGACQAMEDAWIFGNLIAKSGCGPEDVPRILNIYDAVRQPYGNFIMTTSREIMRHGGFDRPEYEGTEGEGLSPEQTSCFITNYEKADSWRWESAEPQLQKALSML